MILNKYFYFRDKFFINFTYKRGNEEKKRNNFMRKYGKQILEKFRKSDPNDPKYEDTPTFREFIEYVLSLPLYKHNPHWLPVYLSCMPCHIKYSIIGRQVI